MGKQLKKPRKQAVALFWLNTGHDCLAAHLYPIKVLSYNHCSICKQKKYNNGQSSPPPVPKTGSNLQRTITAVLGCQKTNGINPRSAIRPQQLLQHLAFKWYSLPFPYPPSINEVISNVWGVKNTLLICSSTCSRCGQSMIAPHTHTHCKQNVWMHHTTGNNSTYLKLWKT